jgi:hypothetical protein
LFLGRSPPLAAVDFDLRFTYVLAGWEGTTHDANVLRDALESVNGLRVPQGNSFTYVLVNDNVYGIMTIIYIIIIF